MPQPTEPRRGWNVASGAGAYITRRNHSHPIICNLLFHWDCFMSFWANTGSWALITPHLQALKRTQQPGGPGNARWCGDSRKLNCLSRLTTGTQRSMPLINSSIVKDEKILYIGKQRKAQHWSLTGVEAISGDVTSFRCYFDLLSIIQNTYYCLRHQEASRWRSPQLILLHTVCIAWTYIIKNR